MNNAALLAVPQPAVSKLGTEGRALHDALKRLELWIEAHNYEASANRSTGCPPRGGR